MASTNRTIVRCLTIPVLSAAALLVACNPDREPTAPADPVGGFQADLVSQNISYLTAQFFANEALIPDGSLTQDDPLPFGHTIHVVDRDNKDSWKIQGSTTVITFDDELTCDLFQAPPLPPGALHLLSTAGDQASRLRSTRYHRTYLRDLTRLDYYACDEQNTGQWPYIVLSIDWDGDNQINESIIFEPSYQNPVQGGTCGAGSAQPEPMLQQWQFWDALRGTPGDPTTFRACWYSTCAFQLPTPPLGCVPFLPGAVIQPLSSYIAAHPNAAIVNLDGNHGGVQISHGVGTGGYNGWVDAFTIGKDINNTSGQTLNSTITYDFQKP
jgi:hypothetical protein